MAAHATAAPVVVQRRIEAPDADKARRATGVAHETVTLCGFSPGLPYRFAG